MATFDNLYQPIPLDAGQVQGWKEIPIKDSPEPLVPLGPLSPEASALMTSSTYFGEHRNSPYTGDNKLEGSLLTLFARKTVARRLLAAEQYLPAGYHLLILDAYRPYKVQKSLHDSYKQKLAKLQPDMDDEGLESETQKYVSLPSLDPTRPSPHNTGGTVDLTIVKLDTAHEEELLRIRSRLAGGNLDMSERVSLEGRLAVIMRRYAKMLDFGTGFDHGGEKSALTYYEAKVAAGETLTDMDMRACNNRRLLCNVMIRAGFQPYYAEWWHFNVPESQMGAASAGLEYATYGAADLSGDNQAHEAARLADHQGVTSLSDDADLPDNWPTELIAPQIQPLKPTRKSSN